MKRTITMLLVVVMLLGVMPFAAFAADWGEGDTLDSALAELKVGYDDTLLDWLVLPNLGVIYLRYSYFQFQNERTGTIDQHPVYCIDPTKGGAYDIVRDVGPNDDGSNTATYIRGDKVGDAKYRGILSAGYPHMRLTGLGLETIEEGYYATKLALWMYIRGNDPTKLTINPKYSSSDPVALRVRNAAVSIYTNGTKAGATNDPSITIAGKPSAVATLDANGQYYVQGIEIHASGWVGTNPDACGDVQLSWASAPPAGTIVLGSNGEDITSTLNVTMSYGANGLSGKATIKYPATSIDPATFTPPTLKATAIVPNNEMYVAYAKVNKDNYQRYLVERDPKIELTASFVSQLTVRPVDEDFPGDTGLRIRKLEAGTNNPLAGAVFEIRDPEGKLIYSLATTANGIIDIPLGVTGNYTVTEVSPPQYHLLSENRTQSVTVRYNEIAEVTFTNAPYGALRVVKRDAENGMPLGGTAVRIRNITTNATQEMFTDSSGSAYFDRLPVGAYEIVEITAPTGYALDSSVHTVNVLPLSEGETSYTLTNKANPGLRISKFDQQTMVAIPGVTFEVWHDGSLYGEYTTDRIGEILLTNLPAGTYTVKEKSTVEPYILNPTPQTIEIKAGQGYISELVFHNLEKPTLIIKKYDELTAKPLPDTEFSVAKKGGVLVWEGLTGSDGTITLPNLEEGWYTITELAPAPGYLPSSGPKDVYLEGGKIVEVKFDNLPCPTLTVNKIDSITKDGLANVRFNVKFSPNVNFTGGVVDLGSFTTDANGQIILNDNLKAGWYRLTELAAPAGYTIAAPASQDIFLAGGENKTLTFENIPKSAIIIRKVDSDNGLPVGGATFTVRYLGGTSGSSGTIIKTVVTSVNGTATIAGLAPGTYVVEETVPASGYELSNPSVQTAYIADNEQAVVELVFSNAKQGHLVIQKYDSASRLPLAGVTFKVTDSSGAVIGPNNGLYTTDVTGVITITENLSIGSTVIVTEVSGPNTHNLDAPAQSVKIKENTTHTLTFYNSPKSGLQIIKTDSITKQPLKGATFRVYKANGEIIGDYETDKNGLIIIPALSPGWYKAVETKAPTGYILDDTPKDFEITNNQFVRLTFENHKESSILLHKTDSMTGKGIYGVRFLISDASGNPMRTVTTDQDGYIFTSGLLDGKYTIQEIAAAPGYYLDPQIKTFYIQYGSTSTIEWKNTPQMGQIQILKKSGDDNEVNGLPAGTPLAGAIFEAYDYKTGNLVDRFVSGSDGRAVSKPLPLGRYIVKEVQAPQWYRLSTQQLDIEIEFATQIIKTEFLNYAANTGVHIRKTGVIQCMPGDTISYTIKAVQNTSTVPLTDFYWRDILPTDAVRLTKIVTGTYNQSLKYKVLITTNKGDTRIIADNLSTTRNNVIDCSNASLGLYNDEYVTSFTLIFGTVKAGFAQVEQPQAFVKTLTTLPNGYQFANKADVGGKYGNEWVVGNTTWLTTIYKKASPLPRTGY